MNHEPLTLAHFCLFVKRKKRPGFKMPLHKQNETLKMADKFKNFFQNKRAEIKTFLLFDGF
jgi:hypothetical protein